MIKVYSFVCKYSAVFCESPWMYPFLCFHPLMDIHCFRCSLSIQTLLAHLAALYVVLLSPLQSPNDYGKYIADWPGVCMSCSGCRKLRTACRPSRASFQTMYTVMHAKPLSEILKQLVPLNLILVSPWWCDKNTCILVIRVSNTNCEHSKFVPGKSLVLAQRPGMLTEVFMVFPIRSGKHRISVSD
jgi:hypothetical protein